MDIKTTYADWISTLSWNLTATIRRHYKLTEVNIRNIVFNLFSKASTKKVFYVIENDRYDNMTHAHLLIDT